jgi:hypothetical protein
MTILARDYKRVDFFSISVKNKKDISGFNTIMVIVGNFGFWNEGNVDSSSFEFRRIVMDGLYRF